MDIGFLRLPGFQTVAQKLKHCRLNSRTVLKIIQLMGKYFHKARPAEILQHLYPAPAPLKS